MPFHPVATKMSDPYLPEELLDHVVDLLCDERDTLKSCCLVSKSWIPRTRKHIFAQVEFLRTESLKSWKTTFPDPSTSPACYAKSLSFLYPDVITDVDGGKGGLIHAFSRVVRVDMIVSGEPILRDDFLSTGPLFTPGPNCLVQFHGFSPATKSLHLTSSAISSSQLFNLVHSFLLLEDLSVTGCDRTPQLGEDSEERSTADQPPPPFTGSLGLYLDEWTGSVAQLLLRSPNGLRFQKLSVQCNREGDLRMAMDFVEACSSTLESLYIFCDPIGGLLLQLRELSGSGATKLKDVRFDCDRDTQWIVAVLRSLARNHMNLQKISIYVDNILNGPDRADYYNDPVNIRLAIGEANYQGWLELDRLFAQLRESHLIKLEVMYTSPHHAGSERAKACMESLLPETSVRGLIDLIDCRDREGSDFS